jgi:hypothetical protein
MQVFFDHFKIFRFYAGPGDEINLLLQDGFKFIRKVYELDANRLFEFN